jgi:hypothetical protein
MTVLATERSPILAAMSVSSALLCLGLIALWIWSEEQSFQIEMPTKTGKAYFHLVSGGFEYIHDFDYEHRNSRPRALTAIGWNWADPTEPINPQAYCWGFQKWHFQGVFDVVVPIYPFVIGSLIAPVVWAARAWRRLRRDAGQRCRVCGYDLRATPDRCPECGTVPRTARKP